jgi:CRP/FNR family cyclic AMP-dependent transcriptional regulator
MKRLSTGTYSREALQRLVRGVTFFKDIVKLDEDQFELLLSVCEFVEAPAGDIVLRKGEEAHTLFFLLKGQVTVLSEDEQSLNHINPGEVFGTLSMVTGRSRSATVKAEADVILLGIDFKYFQAVNDFSMFSMDTKLVAYRMVVHNIRWTLEMNKMQDPEHELASRLLKLPLYMGVKGGKEELESLYEQSRVLADLLCDWNDSMEVVQ